MFRTFIFSANQLQKPVCFRKSGQSLTLPNVHVTYHMTLLAGARILSNVKSDSQPYFLRVWEPVKHHSLHFLFSVTLCFFPFNGQFNKAVLTQTYASEALDICPYFHVVLNPLLQWRFSEFYYFFLTFFFIIKALCPDSLGESSFQV